MPATGAAGDLEAFSGSAPCLAAARECRKGRHFAGLDDALLRVSTGDLRHGLGNGFPLAFIGHNLRHHMEPLAGLIGALAPLNLIMMVRYSATQRPDFASHRNFSGRVVREYLDTYYVFDPFYAHWRKHQKPGVYMLNRLQAKAQRRGNDIAEFLGQSVISDEVGVMLNDGPGWCLGIFLDRKKRRFTSKEIARLESGFTVFATIHDLDTRSRASNFMRTCQSSSLGREPLVQDATLLPADLWPELSARERELVKLILAGHPTASIARKLGIAAGTAKNHRLHIYKRLDITTERELFLQYIDRRLRNGATA
jgi:DNA-binding CsgD family transcriptional regulator